MDFNPTFNVRTENNFYEKLIYNKYYNAGLGAAALVSGIIAQNFFSDPYKALPFASCASVLIGRALGISTALSKVTETIENRIYKHYTITMQDAKSLIVDEAFLATLGNGALIITGTILATDIWDPGPNLLLLGGTLGSYFVGKALGIDESLEIMGLR